MNNNHLYSDRESKLDTLIGQTTDASAKSYDHWRTLEQAKAEHDTIRLAQGLAFDLDAFSAWMEETYGIQLQQVDTMIGQKFKIVDEAKYLVYQLKYV